MKKNGMKNITYSLAMAALLSAALTGCGQSIEMETRDGEGSMAITGSVTSQMESPEDGSSQEAPGGNSAAAAEATELYVSFGDEGSPFPLHLYDNDTAAAIARHVGTADWRLPIYHYDGYDNWEVMQYYDIPSRYEIPSNPETVTTQQAGAVYYSEPNRIVLFYGDAEVPGEYTPVGYFDYSEEFAGAVAGNPVLEGWGNKIVIIRAGE